MRNHCRIFCINFRKKNPKHIRVAISIGISRAISEQVECNTQLVDGVVSPGMCFYVLEGTERDHSRPDRFHWSKQIILNCELYTREISAQLKKKKHRENL